MNQDTLTQIQPLKHAPFTEAWQAVLGQLRGEMSRAMFETWVQPLQPLSYREKVFTIGAYNPYARGLGGNPPEGSGDATVGGHPQ